MTIGVDPVVEIGGAGTLAQSIAATRLRGNIALIRAIDANGIKPVIDRSFGLKAIADALRHQESGAQFGKICLEW